MKTQKIKIERTIISNIPFQRPNTQEVDLEGKPLERVPYHFKYGRDWRYETDEEAIRRHHYIVDDYAIVIEPREKRTGNFLLYGLQEDLLDENFLGYRARAGSRTTPQRVLDLIAGAEDMEVGEVRKKSRRSLKRLQKNLFLYKHDCGDQVGISLSTLRNLTKALQEAV